MDEIKAKQQVVEKIKESSKILVTVSNSPSVDALSAALALTLILDKQEKYSTAIFSGETPPAIAFLEPEKTFDDSTDSLRDFIIALNKEKADHLRYKVEGDSVKIFITPYKTTIDQSDLEFSQGDYNVELVIALGVDSQEHLDQALEDHGKILHDAAIITMTAGEQTSDLGGVDWHEAAASSLSEMVAGLAEALKEDKKKSLLDEAIATALLTGIVAETDRFSNEHTTSKVMTVAANLMAAGADQQLIANELTAKREEAELERVEAEDDTDHGDSDSDSEDDEKDVEVDKESSDGTMTIKSHEDPSTIAISHEGETLADLDLRVLGEKKAKKKVIDEVELKEKRAARVEAEEDVREEEAELAELQATEGDVDEAQVEENAYTTPVEEETSVDAPQEVHDAYAAPAEENAYTPAELSGDVHSAYALDDAEVEPTLGGTLNATTEQAADDARRALENDQNRTILSHSYLGSAAEPNTSVSETSTASEFPGTPNETPGSAGVNDFSVSAAEPSEATHSAYAPDSSEYGANNPSGPVGGERVIQPLSEQPAPTVVQAFDPVPTPTADPQQPLVPIPQGPVDLGLPMPPALPDFSQVNGPALPLPATPPPAILGDILAPEPAAPAQPTVDVEPATLSEIAPNAGPTLPPLNPDAANDPGQFQIPSR